MWIDILKSRHENVKFKVLIGDKSVVGKKDLIWCKDILVFDNYELFLNNHFAGAVEGRVGNGENTPFWYSCWLEKQPMLEDFPECFVEEVNHV